VGIAEAVRADGLFSWSCVMTSDQRDRLARVADRVAELRGYL
jgi:hypothetical protein